MDKWVWLLIGVTIFTLVESRIIDGGGSGLLSQRGWMLILLVLPVVTFWQEGPLLGIAMSVSVVGIFTLVFMPTPKWLRRANWLRAKSVREAVANSRTIWDSYDYKPPKENDILENPP